MMADNHFQTTGNEIAIIGIACRFPGANDVDTFWHNLQHGIETIAFLNDDELEPSVIDHTTDPTHPHFVRAAATIEGIDLFDAQFFGYAPKDAALIDPQQRLFLEYAWTALEAAGYDPERYPEAVGVFAGARTNTYIYNLLFNRPAVGNLTPFEIGVSNDFSCLSTRVAYKLNLRGPAYSLHTACSTGLAAIHLACQSVLIGECRMAIAGGVAIDVPQRTGYLYRESGIVSPDGHCRAFDAGAAGTVLGSGIGVVVLKRLDDALADGDTIHAVIKGSAANNDGAAKASYTAPSVDGQAAVIEEALAVAGVEPATIGYVEAHGTGTHLGDPIEIRALTKAFRSSTTRNGSCAIGSVKTNFGHLESAAGLAGLIKTVLALKHKQIPASLHYTRANPDLHLEQTPFYVNTALSEWQATDTPRRAGVSAFGVGGTNIHIILEEAPPQTKTPIDRPWQLLPISAKTPTALDQATAQLADFLETHPELHIADAAYTLQVGRGEFDYRRIAVCRDRAHAIQVLRGDDPQHLMSDMVRVGDRPLVWMFAGQGSQYMSMAADLYSHVALFREQIDRCAERLRQFVDFDVRRLLARSDVGDEWINQTEVAQPALFVVEYALAQTLMAWKLKPTSMIGHSIGEYVAACLAGVFSLEDALRLVTLRGQLMQALPTGAMLTVGLPEAELRSRLHPEGTWDLDLAAINAPDSTVVSGEHSAIERFARQLEAQGVSYRRLETSHAFHSRMMDPMLAAFEQAVAKATLSPPQIPFISNLSGTWIRAEEATSPRYWAQHLRHTVRFADGLAELLQQPNAVLLDLGPARTLSRLAQRHPARQDQHTVIAALGHPKDQASDLAVLLTALGKLWLAGITPDWPSISHDEQRLRVALPTYPFERQRYWIDPQPDSVNSGPVPIDVVAQQQRNPIDAWFYTPSWRRVARSQPAELTQEHKNWLIFAPANDDFSDRLIVALEQAGQTVIAVAPGERYHELRANRYTVSPHAREDYLTLAGALMADGKLPDVALHLWSLTHRPASPLTVESFNTAQSQGFYSLLFFAQAFSELIAALKLVVVTQQLYDVRGDEELRPELATLLGPCTVIPQEYPHIDCRVIDVVLPAHNQDDLITALLDEVSTPTDERVVALRGRHRWAQDLAAVQRPQPTPTPIRRQAVYLITGGLSEAGYLFAEYLARTAAAKLILLDAEPLPPRGTWDQWVASYGPQNEVSARITNARALEATGAELLLLSADFADLSSMQTAVEQATATFGPIRGVIHAAHVLDSGLIPLRSFDAIEHQFTAKAKGCINLHTVLRDADLDFFVLFSSINAILGELGQVDQCAANSFLDLYAQASAASGSQSITVINWDAWQANSATVQTMLQMAAIPAIAAERLQQEVNNGLSADEGIAAFLRIVAGKPLPQIVISTQDMPTRFAHVALLTQDLRRARESLTFVKEQYGRPDLQTAYVAPSTDDEHLVANIWQDVLGIEQIGVHDDFFELGGHSLLVTMIAGRLRDALGVDIPIEKLFEKPTIAGILETKAEIQTTEDSAAAEIMSLLAQLSDEEAELELQRRLTSLEGRGGETKR